MEKEIHCFLTAISPHTYAATFYTEQDLDPFDGDWHAWARARGHQTTANLGSYEVLEGETPKQAFARVRKARQWPGEGDLRDFA